eukprot:gnl/MRDRNA2_/MRDRNA2_74900_c0_seq1.p1 gnl/MRDRNA2_/MRDRNA2_74900_c0~~gnl/MRDRNA2_/MRDRNA2_74900_c0_seq1.p1  ORF type:complete len:130 (-),score=21.17 gnl/MRDRNA2_/MRDRNA2_74900_c0_seq1:36-425(-)
MCVCSSMKAITEVLRFIVTYPGVMVLQLNDRFSKDTNGWADCALYITSDDPDYKHIVCEIQIVHHSLLHVREKLGAHDIYDECRFGSELLRKWYDKKSETEPWCLDELQQTTSESLTVQEDHVNVEFLD